MKSVKSSFILILILIISFNLNAQTQEIKKSLDSIQKEAIQGQLEFLSSDWMEGREAGTHGSYMAADYIASMFKVFGVQPAGDVEWKRPSRAERREGKMPEQLDTYFQNFSLLAYKAGEDQQLKLVNRNGTTYDFEYHSDFSVSTGTVGIEASAPVVFAGYGYKNEEKDYNDFEDIDVRGKFILRLWGYPGWKDTSCAAYKKFQPKGRYAVWSMRREKDELAEELGAIGVIEVNLEGNGSMVWAENYPFRYNSDNYEGTEQLRPGTGRRLTIPGDTLSSMITTINVSNRLANELLRETGVSFEQFENDVAENMEPDSKTLKGKKLYVKTSVKSEIIRGRNVLAMIEGENKDEIVMIGAHYDHVGTNKGYIWNGSDDNASGTVGMLNVARAVASTGVKPKRTIMFAAWTAEEKGLLGSKYFVDNFHKIENVEFYLNFDMISRNDDDDTLGNKFSMSYSSDYPALEENSKKFNEELGIGLDIKYIPSKQPRGGSDHASFSAKDIPVAYYFGGFHPDYHGISDTADKADYSKMISVIKLGFREIWELANSANKLSVNTEESK